MFEEKVPKQKVRSSFSGVYLHTSGQDNHVPTTVLVLLPFGQEKRRSCLSLQCSRAGGTSSYSIWHCLPTKSACYQFKATMVTFVENIPLGKGKWQAILALLPQAAACTRAIFLRACFSISLPHSTLTLTCKTHVHGIPYPQLRHATITNLNCQNIFNTRKDLRCTQQPPALKSQRTFSDSFFSDTERDSVPRTIRISGTS